MVAAQPGGESMSALLSAMMKSGAVPDEEP
jgi:hypothetical protein